MSEGTPDNHFILLRFYQDEVDSIESFHEIMNSTSEEYGFKYDELVKDTKEYNCARASFSSGNLNECLSMAMKIFEIYLTAKNR